MFKGYGGKKHMRKETGNVLKGIAGVGAAIGGAAAFNEADVVYAAALEQKASEEDQVELEQGQTASEIEAGIESLLEASESASLSTVESLSTAKAQSESAANKLASENEALSEQASEANSAWASTSTYLSESTSFAMSELGSASEVASEAVEDYKDAVDEFENSLYNTEY